MGIETRWWGLGDDDVVLALKTANFVESSVKPYLSTHQDEEWQAPPDQRVPWPLIEEADQLGLRTLGLPESLGGAALTSVLSYAVVSEELARGEPSLVDILLQGWKVGAIIASAAPQHLRQHWLERFAREPRLLFSHCSTEPQGSSDRWLGYDVPEAAMRTRAGLEDGQWVLNGTKQYITNGPDSGLYVVYACTTAGAPLSQGTSSFLVPRGTGGFTIGQVYEKLGGRLFNNAELIFEDCRIPEDHLLIRDTAAGTSGRLFPGSKVIIAAQAVGLAQAAYEDTAEFVQTRVQGGKPIVQHQVVAARLADMAISIESARALVRHAARAIDLKAPNRRALAFMAKVSAGETAFNVARQAVELHGGQGVMRNEGIERYLRDASLFFHIDGTNDIHRFRVIKELFPGVAGQYAGPEPGRMPGRPMSGGSGQVGPDTEW